MTDERTVPQVLLELRTLVEWRLGGQRAVPAKAQPDQPRSAGHLSWMLARSLQAFERGDLVDSARYQGYVEGALSALGVSSGGSEPERGEPVDPLQVLPFSEHEQRVWAGVFSACLAHGACQNVMIDPRKAAGKAYEAVLALRRLPHGAAWRFPEGWRSSEPSARCRARDSGGAQCELPYGHEGEHACPNAVEGFRQARQYEPVPGGVRQPVVVTTGDFQAELAKAVEARFGKDEG